jgi:hypothetical protein
MLCGIGSTKSFGYDLYLMMRREWETHVFVLITHLPFYIALVDVLLM